jgi:polyhydroxybutyrate depolymerase
MKFFVLIFILIFSSGSNIAQPNGKLKEILQKRRESKQKEYEATKNLKQMSIVSEGRTRTYLLYVPHKTNPVNSLPLVFAFHGGGGSGSAFANLTKFHELAETEDFIVIYPDGTPNKSDGKRLWNDGRQGLEGDAFSQNINDVKFIEDVINKTKKEFNIDSKRIYATGLSNGAAFSHRLAAELSSQIAAIATMASGIGVPFNRTFNPSDPVSVFITQATKDPLSPYKSEGIVGSPRSGTILNTEDTLNLWKKTNGIIGSGINGSLPDINKDDGCKVETQTWTNGKNNTQILFYKLIGGGHTWAGGAQYLPKSIIGSVCRDYNQTEVVWKFFKENYKR